MGMGAPGQQGGMMGGKMMGGGMMGSQQSFSQGQQQGMSMSGQGNMMGGQQPVKISAQHCCRFVD